MPKTPPLDQQLIIILPLTVIIAIVYELSNPQLGSQWRCRSSLITIRWCFEKSIEIVHEG
jgi:hypothetical protein